MASPNRILQVLGRMNRGGAESMIMNLYRNIDRTKLQFDFVVHTSDKCAFDDEILSLGGKIHKMPRYTGRNHFEYKKCWNVFFEDYPEYEIIHGHVRSTASIYLSIAKEYGLTTIAHSHSTSNGKGLSSVIKKILQIPIKKHSDYLFAASTEAGIWLFGEKSVKRNKFYILKNAINTEKFIYNKKIRKNKRNELNINDEVIIGHVGNFRKPKNHLFLIDIFKEYHKINPNSLLLMVGEGDLMNEVYQKVKNNNITEKVVFLGVRSDISELLQAMDVFVFPSLFEGLPVTLIEAQAAGLPILASDAITEEVKITDSISFENIQDEPAEWAKKIEEKLIISRTNKYQDIVDGGYDVKQTAAYLQDYYLNLINKVK